MKSICKATWTIPGERMKAGRPHRVPLSLRALEVLAEAQKIMDGVGWFFRAFARECCLTAL